MRYVKKIAPLLLILFAVSALAAAKADQPLSDPAAEARAQAIFEQVRCVVCQSESIADSQADLAHDLRQMVRDKIADSWSDQQVLDYLRARYGDYILLRPPLQDNTYALWMAPLLIFSFAGGLVILFLWRHRKKTGQA